MKKMWIFAISLSIGFSAVPTTGFAITAQQLQEMLGRGEKVTVVDIRSNWAYAESHILGAINIPASVIAMKRLPPLGRVIVCGDGIRTDLTLQSLQALNAKTGIQADMVEGGFGAWDALNLPNTRKSGFGRERLRYLSYQELEKAAANNPDMVLVDLRRMSEEDETALTGMQSISARRGGSVSQGTQEAMETDASGIVRGNKTDLSEKFPGLNTMKLTRKLRSAGKDGSVSTAPLASGKGNHHRKVYVLIDDGDGEAEKVAHRLQAAGIRRVVILAGGERILRREGCSGLKTIESGN